MQERIDAYLEKTYRDPLKADPDNERLRAELLRLYLALRQYDTAIETALDYLLERRGDKAPTYNQLGIAYFLKGEFRQAAYHFQQAAALRSENQGIQDNLTRALQALGKGEGIGEEKLAREEEVGSSKGDWLEGDEGSFYWIE